MRRKSRETAFKLIYANLFESDYAEDDVYKENCLTEDEIEYCKRILNVYNQNKNQTQERLKNILKGYELERVYKIDLALIILAFCENEYLQVPKAVVINEVLEICKIYSTDKSPSFINGILKDLLK